ncbi:MAG: thiamine pyrophosphate-binding protein, partial [Pseudomonadota bacterium]
MTQPRHGGKILADQLAILGATRLFCVPGESFLGLLDGLHDHQNGIQTVACRHEAGATNAAEAHGKLTGLPGLAAVTRGPGATNGSNGVHTAFQDSTPMILFIGQVNRGMLDREAFQEMDYRRVFGEMAKWVAEIGSADRIPEYVGRAWETALSGRPGPVVLALPEETLREEATVEDLRPIPRIAAAPSAAALARVVVMIAAAAAPLLLLGGA